MSTTYMDDTATYTITLPGEEIDPEVTCQQEECPKVALWRMIVQHPCEHSLMCEGHAEEARPFLSSWLEWECKNCGKFVGRFLRLEPLQGGRFRD